MPKRAALTSAADNICFASSSVRLVYVRGISPHLHMDRILKRPCADRKCKRLFHAAPPGGAACSQAARGGARAGQTPLRGETDGKGDATPGISVCVKHTRAEAHGEHDDQLDERR